MAGRHGRWFVVAAAAALVAAVGTASAGAAESAATQGDSVLVKLQPWAESELSPGQRPVIDGWAELPVAPGESTEAAVARWAAHPAVEFAEPNRTTGVAPIGSDGVRAIRRVEGDDPLAHHQWHMPLVQAERARAAADGRAVTVALLDTGISLDGSDLACHELVHPYDAITRTAGAATDINGHGTHIAGTVAQCTGNGVGVTGMAPGVSLMPVRVLDAAGGGDYADLAVGIDWARTHGADIINLSLGGACAAPWPSCSSLVVNEAIERAAASDIVIVAAVGNRASVWVDFPANHPDVIAVGAVDSGLRPAYYSNGGIAVDIMAPGGDTDNDRNGDGLADGVVQESFGPGGWGYWAWAGTSYAAPHVTGTAALVRSAAPQATASEVRAALQCTAQDLGAAGRDDRNGHGLVQAAAAVAAVTAGRYDSNPPVWPQGAEALVVDDRIGTVHVSWPAATDCDRVERYRVLIDGVMIADVAGRATSATVPAGGTTYAIEALDPSGNVAPALAVDMSTAPSVASGDQPGLVDPATGLWYLPGRTGGAKVFYFGDPGDVPFVGDWDCDGVATPGLYRPADGYVYLRNSNDAGIADAAFYFGNPGDVPLAGDFNGDGCDTVSLYRPSEARVYVVNRLGSRNAGLGRADLFYTLGDPGDLPFAGDFDGDGDDEVGVRRPATGRIHLRFGLSGGPADATFTLGDPGDVPISGDWDGDGVDTPGVFRPADGSFHVGGTPQLWGEIGWLPVAGRF